MSGYRIDEDDITYIVDENGNEKMSDYWLLYSDFQRKRNNNVLKQLKDIWWQVQAPLLILHNEGINLDDIMMKISRLFFGYMRLNKQQENDKKQRLIRNKKINRLKNKIYPI